MNTMQDLLNQITSVITQFRGLSEKVDFNEIQTILYLMQCLSSDLFFLEEHLDTERQAYYSTIVKLLKNHSATEAEKRAKDLHPEKRKLERFITSAYKVLDAMRSKQSHLKKEQS